MRRGVVTGVRGRRTRMGATRRPPQLVAFSSVASRLPITVTPSFYRQKFVEGSSGSRFIHSNVNNFMTTV